MEQNNMDNNKEELVVIAETERHQFTDTDYEDFDQFEILEDTFTVTDSETGKEHSFRKIKITGGTFKECVFAFDKVYFEGGDGTDENDPPRVMIDFTLFECPKIFNIDVLKNSEDFRLIVFKVFKKAFDAMISGKAMTQEESRILLPGMF